MHCQDQKNINTSMLFVKSARLPVCTMQAFLNYYFRLASQTRLLPQTADLQKYYVYVNVCPSLLAARGTKFRLLADYVSGYFQFIQCL